MERPRWDSLADRFKLREKKLAKIERQFNRLDEKLTALESDLPALDEQAPTDQIRQRKPR